jgi:hypothetical protein
MNTLRPRQNSARRAECTMVLSECMCVCVCVFVCAVRVESVGAPEDGDAVGPPRDAAVHQRGHRLGVEHVLLEREEKGGGY